MRIQLEDENSPFPHHPGDIFTLEACQNEHELCYGLQAYQTFRFGSL